MFILEITRNERTSRKEFTTAAAAEKRFDATARSEQAALDGYKRPSGYACSVKLLTDEGVTHHQEFCVAG